MAPGKTKMTYASRQSKSFLNLFRPPRKYRTTYFFLKVLFYVLLVLVLLDFFWVEDWKDFKTNLLVEAHGVLGDVIIFGVVLSLYDLIKSENTEIRRLHEEIDDYRQWDEKEAKFRINGNIRRLQGFKEEIYNLNECYLEGATLSNMRFENSNFDRAFLINANLKESILINCSMKDCVMKQASLNGAFISQINMSGTDFTDAVFINTVFDDVNLDDTRLDGVVVDSPNWSSKLNPTSLQYINDRYKLVPKDEYVSIFGLANINNPALYLDDTFFLVDNLVL